MKDIKIYCNKYKWSSGTTVANMNFFSGVAPESIEEFELTNYLIDIGKLTYTNESMEFKNQNILYFEDSDISFTVSGSKNTKYLLQYLNIGNIDPYTKYLLTIEDEDEKKIFKGIIHQWGIDETFSASPTENETIKITSIGFLKEFKDYYSAIPLPDRFLINWNNGGTIVWLQSLLEQLLNTDFINIVLDEDIHNYLVSQTGYISYFNKIFFVKTGYHQIQANGENIYGFLQKMCFSRGWIFLFDGDSLVLKNRSSIQTEKTILDYNRFVTPLNVFSKQAKDKIDYLVMVDGEYYGGDYTGFGSNSGRRYYTCYVFRNNGEFFWGNPTLQPTIPFNLNVNQFFNFNNNTMTRVLINNDSTFQFDLVQSNGVGYLAQTLNKVNILLLNTGDTGQHGTLFNTQTGANFIWETGHSGTISNNDLFFTGNYGNCLYKTNGLDAVMYYDFIETDTFKKNIQKYFTNANTINLKVIYPTTDIDLLKNYQIINSPNSDFNGEYIASNIELDLTKKETTFELQKVMQ